MDKEIVVLIEMSEEEFNIVKNYKGPLTYCEYLIKNGTPVDPETFNKEPIPYIMHKEMDIPLLECQKAYDIAIEYLRKQGKLKG